MEVLITKVLETKNALSMIIPKWALNFSMQQGTSPLPREREPDHSLHVMGSFS